MNGFEPADTRVIRIFTPLRRNYQSAIGPLYFPQAVAIEADCAGFLPIKRLLYVFIFSENARCSGGNRLHHAKIAPTNKALKIRLMARKFGTRTSV